jgi:hypothetical protein
MNILCEIFSFQRSKIVIFVIYIVLGYGLNQCQISVVKDKRVAFLIYFGAYLIYVLIPIRPNKKQSISITAKRTK